MGHEDEVGTRAEVKSDVKEKTKESRGGKGKGEREKCSKRFECKTSSERKRKKK